MGKLWYSKGTTQVRSMTERRMPPFTRSNSFAYHDWILRRILPVNLDLCFELSPSSFSKFIGWRDLLARWFRKGRVQLKDHLGNNTRQVLVIWTPQIQAPLMRLKFSGLFAQIEGDTAADKRKTYGCVLQTTSRRCSRSSSRGGRSCYRHLEAIVLYQDLCVVWLDVRRSSSG